MGWQKQQKDANPHNTVRFLGWQKQQKDANPHNTVRFLGSRSTVSSGFTCRTKVTPSTPDRLALTLAFLNLPTLRLPLYRDRAPLSERPEGFFVCGISQPYLFLSASRPSGPLRIPIAGWPQKHANSAPNHHSRMASNSSFPPRIPHSRLV